MTRHLSSAPPASAANAARNRAAVNNAAATGQIDPGAAEASRAADAASIASASGVADAADRTGDPPGIIDRSEEGDAAVNAVAPDVGPIPRVDGRGVAGFFRAPPVTSIPAPSSM